MFNRQDSICSHILKTGSQSVYYDFRGGFTFSLCVCGRVIRKVPTVKPAAWAGLTPKGASLNSASRRVGLVANGEGTSRWIEDHDVCADGF